MLSDEDYERCCEVRKRTGWGRDWSPLRSAFPTRQCTGRSGAAAARGAPGSHGQGGSLRVALSGQPPAHGHQAPCALHRARPCGDRGAHRALARRRLGVRPHPRRRLLAPGLCGDPRRRARRHRRRLHASRPGLVLGARDRHRAAALRQRLGLRQEQGPGQLLGERGIEHWRTKPYSPQTNGKVERLQQTMDREWARGLSYRSSADRRAALPRWLDHYNESRRHSALGNRPPMARVRDVLAHDI
jgi:hypothetical protein